MRPERAIDYADCATRSRTRLFRAAAAALIAWLFFAVRSAGAIDITIDEATTTALTRARRVGINIEMVLTSDEMWAANGQWMKQTLRGSGIDMIRWGYEAWNWDWENDRPFDATFTYAARNTPNAAGTFGAREFVALCRETGIVPLLMVPASDRHIASVGWPAVLAKAGRLALYLKEQGIPDAYFELGNEPGYTNEGVPQSQYISRAKELYATIKGVQAAYKTVLSMHSYDYNTIVSQMAGQFDALDWHSYWAMGTGWTSYYNTDNDAFFPSGQAPSGKESILGETNVLVPNWSGHMANDFQSSLILSNALLGAIDLQRNSHVVTWPSHWPTSVGNPADDYGLFSYDAFMTGTPKETVLLDGPIIAHRLVNENVLDRKVPRSWNDPKLRVFAYASNDGERLNVIVINKATASKDIVLRLGSAYDNVSAFLFSGSSAGDKAPRYAPKFTALTPVTESRLADSVPATSLVAYQFQRSGGTATPGPFALIAPGNGQQYVSTAMLFEWSESAGAKNYHLTVASNPAFSAPVLDLDVGNRTSYQALSNTLARDTVYFWKVIAANRVGMQTAAGGGMSFKTVPSVVNQAPNQPPTVGIVSPPPDSQVVHGATIVVKAAASDTDGSISQVSFFLDNTPLGIDTVAPYGIAIPAVPDGRHVLKVQASDVQGAQSNVATVPLTVGSPPTAAPEPVRNLHVIGQTATATGTP